MSNEQVMVAAFKDAWEAADARGETGHRTEAGIRAAIAAMTPTPDVDVIAEVRALSRFVFDDPDVKPDIEFIERNDVLAILNPEAGR